MQVCSTKPHELPRRQVKKVVLRFWRCFFFSFTEQSVHQVWISYQDRNFLKHSLKTEAGLSNSTTSKKLCFYSAAQKYNQEKTPNTTYPLMGDTLQSYLPYGIKQCHPTQVTMCPHLNPSQAGCYSHSGQVVKSWDLLEHIFYNPFAIDLPFHSDSLNGWLFQDIFFTFS